MLWIVLLVLYACWFYYTRNDRHCTRHWGPQWLVGLVSRAFKLFFWVMGTTHTVIMEAPLLEGKRYLIAASPHGAFALSGVCFTAPSWRLSKDFKQHRIFSIGASALFVLPVIREAILLLGGREVTKANAERLLRAGNSLGMVPGGIWEMVNTDHLREKAYVQKNLGFLRLAVQHQLHVVPMYGFGENQLFTTHTFALKWRHWLARSCWWGMPLVTGKGGCTVLPHAVDLVQVYGEAIDTAAIDAAVRADAANEGKTEAEVAEAVVEAVYVQYKQGVLGIFDRHASAFLPAHVAKKGLAFTRLGHDVDPGFQR